MSCSSVGVTYQHAFESRLKPRPSGFGSLEGVLERCRDELICYRLDEVLDLHFEIGRCALISSRPLLFEASIWEILCPWMTKAIAVVAMKIVQAEEEYRNIVCDKLEHSAR